MSRSINVVVNGEEFICTSFYDVDTNCNGVDISYPDGTHIDSVMCVELPDEDDDDYEVLLEMFIEEIEDFV